MAKRHRDLDSARQFGRSLQYLHDLQPATVASGNDILPILAVNNVLYDAQPKQITISGLADSLSPYITGGGGGTASASGIDGSVQYYSSGILAGDTNFLWDTQKDLLSINNLTGVVASGGLAVTSGNVNINYGDAVLNDGGVFTTTLQCVTPTANRTISFPDNTGTVALVAGSSSQLIYNNAGTYAGVSTFTANASGELTLASRFTNSYTSVVSSPAETFTGTWYTGGTATTTKPHFLIEPTGTTSTAWSTSGTGLGVNAASGFTGRLLDLQINGTSRAIVDASGKLLVGTNTARTLLTLQAEGVASGETGLSLILNNSSAGAGPVFTLGRSRGGSVDSNTIVQVNDALGYIGFNGADGVDIGNPAAVISAFVDAAPGSNDMPGRMVFSTSADASVTPTERLRITSEGVIAYNQPAPTSKSAAATLTIAELKTAIVQYTGAADTLTLPTGTLMEGGFNGVYTNMTFEWSVINTGSGTCTIGAGADHTIVGSTTVAIGDSGRFASRRTAANTYVTYRIS